MQKYTPKYFRDNLPSEKKKQDSFLVRSFYRPASFYTASLANKMNLTANHVSIISIVLSFVITILYTTRIYILEVIAALLISVWMILDCTDGNLARGVKSMPYGEFLDAISGYFVIELLLSVIGFEIFFEGGYFEESIGNVFFVFMGCFAATSDAMSRLTYQKYVNVQNDENRLTNMRCDSTVMGKKNLLYRFHDRIDKEVGLNGLFIPAITICTILKTLDVFVLFYFIYYVINFFGSTFLLIRKTLK